MNENHTPNHGEKPDHSAELRELFGELPVGEGSAAEEGCASAGVPHTWPADEAGPEAGEVAADPSSSSADGDAWRTRESGEAGERGSLRGHSGSRTRSRGRSRRKKKWYRRPLLLIPSLFVALLAVITTVALLLVSYLNSSIQHIPLDISVPSAGKAKQSQQINYLVLGSDSRSSGGDPTDWYYGGERSDVIMVVTISGDRNSITAMSIPRDSWVEIPGHGQAKINAAFSYGGPKLTIQTVEQLLDIHIDHFAIVDFEGFKQITDAIGGVTIPTKTGQTHMDGAEALAYVRERYSLPNGDFDRVRRQQAWIRAIMKQMSDGKVLSSPTKIRDLFTSVTKYSAMDQGLTLAHITEIGLSLGNSVAGNVRFFTIPTAGTGTSPDGTQSIVNLNAQLLPELSAAWKKDSITAFLNEHKEVQVLTDAPVN